MSDRVANLRALTADVTAAAIELRRAIHEHPEIGWEERETTTRLFHALRSFGLDPAVRPDGIGLHLDVGNAEPAVGFRADLDALPIDEMTGAAYASRNPGVMHACGHDVHAAIGVGVATVLSRLEDLPGRVRFIFQPAEEKVPGGANVLREEGVHHGLSAVLAYHVDPSLEPGNIGVREGAITGASDRLTIRLEGPGGHTSRPHLTTDLVYAAARVITDLPVLLRQTIDPRETASIVFGRVEGGLAENVIPTAVELGATVRLFDLERWREMPTVLEDLVRDIVGPLGATTKVQYHRGSPPVVNDAAVVGAVIDAGRACLGPAGVRNTHQSLGSEDFAWFLEDVPGALIRLGSALDGRSVDLHSATFDIDESAIATGILVAAECLLRLLEAHD